VPGTRGARPGAAVPTAAAELAGGGEQDDAAMSGSDTPVLRLGGYAGPLDALLDEARAGRVDLRRLPVLALVEQCVAAVDAAVLTLRRAAADRGAATGQGPAREGARAGDREGAEEPTPAPAPEAPPLQRLTEWVGMAAWLTWLRSRLLLPEGDPQARAAREEADAWRRDLIERAAMRAAADWLDERPQLGRDVFAGGATAEGAREAAERAAAEHSALLRSYTRRIDPVAAAAPGQERDLKDAAYRPRPPLLWRVPDALRWIERLLDKAPGPEAGAGADLWRFLPDAEDLVPASDSDPALLGGREHLRCRPRARTPGPSRARAGSGVRPRHRAGAAR
jgi:segregation and condensation protein A